MKQVIYIDTYFLVNAIMNYTVLSLSGRLLFGTLKKRRILTASLLGSAYACGVLTVSPKGIFGILLWGLCLWAMEWIAFGKHPLKKQAVGLAMNLVFSFLLGGMLQGLSSIFLSDQEKIRLSLVAAAAIFGSSFFYIWAWKAREKMNQSRVSLQMTAFGKEYQLCGLCDSGNLLRDPDLGRPVILLGNCLSQDPLLAPFYLGTDPPEKNCHRIPITTASGSKQIYGFTPESVKIITNKKTVIRNEVMIGADPACYLFSDCECLVPTSIL